MASERNISLTNVLAEAYIAHAYFGLARPPTNKTFFPTLSSRWVSSKETLIQRSSFHWEWRLLDIIQEKLFMLNRFQAVYEGAETEALC